MTSTTLEKYETYKDTRVEWLGKIPTHWKVKRAKDIALITRGAILRPVDEPSYFDPEGEWHYLNISDATKCDKYLYTSKLRLSKLGSTKSARVKQNSLIITASATIGKPFINKIKVCVHDGFIPFSQLKISNEFLYYYLLNSNIYSSLGKSNTQKNIYLDEVKNIPISFPDRETQTAIVDYLDEKTAVIDHKTDLLTQKAAQYQQLKQALINETVTRGLNKSAPLKDSGIDWLGEIPAHWEFKHFKQFSTMKGRIGWQGLKHSEFTDEGPFLITGMNFKKGNINWDEVYHITEERYEQAPEIQLRDNDVLMTKDGTIGKLLFVEDIPFPHKASLNSHLLVFRPIKNSYYPKYLYYQLDSSTFEHYTEIVKTGTTFFGISQAAVGKYIAILPPLSEQKAIADYLDTKTAHIDSIVDTINHQIKTLQELRKTLINEVVTGKIKIIENG